jgi:hypothetical protein
MCKFDLIGNIYLFRFFLSDDESEEPEDEEEAMHRGPPPTRGNKLGILFIK